MSHPGIAYARKGGVTGAIVGGLGAGILGAAANGLPKRQYNLASGKKEELTNKQRVTKAVVGGLSFGAVGAMHGHTIGYNHNARKWNAGMRPSAVSASKPPDWLKGAKTKAEARKAYHAQARKHHPDLGGSPDAIKKLNQEWEAHEPLYKKAMYVAFADELEKIASVGALLGGAAGYKLAPNTISGKIMGIAGGAAAGQAVGTGLTIAKKQLIDDPNARDRAALHGYVPVAAEQAGQPPRFY
jgi:hypothetical protein